MEKRVDSLVFRRLTYADFRHINKVGGEEMAEEDSHTLIFRLLISHFKNGLTS